MKKKVFCFFNGRSRLGGVERRVGRVLNEISKAGYCDIRLVFLLFEPLEDVKKAYEQVIGDCSLTMVGCNNHIEVNRYVKEERPDTVMYTGGHGSAMPFILAARFFSEHRILLSVTTNTSMRRFNSLRERWLFDIACRLSTKIDCLYPSASPLLQQSYPTKTVSTTPCPHIPLAIFAPIRKKRQITYIARWERIKNPELFIDAIELAADTIRREGYTVVMGGNAKNEAYTREIKDRIAEKGLEDLIRTPGYVVSENYLPETEVFLSLQDFTNYPSQSLLEAISCGCYIIASDVGDTRNIVESSFGVCHELRPRDVADAIIRYISKGNSEKKRIVVDAREYAERTFLMTDSVAYYMDLIGVEQKED